MNLKSGSSVLTDCEFLVRAIQGIVWEADPKTIRFTFVSERAERILGYPAADWLKDDFWINHLHPDDRDEAIESCGRATAQGLDHEFEYRMIHADGSERWFRDTVFVDMEEGRPVRLRGVLIDITEEKHLETAIHDSEQLLRLIVSSAKDAIFRRRIHPEVRFEYISPAVQDITGYSPEEFYADPTLGSKIVHPEDQKLEATSAFMVPTGEASTIRIVRKSGSVAWIEMRSVTIYDDAGRAVAIEGIARDITERKQPPVQIQPSQELEAVGRLVSGVTHDFNNLLTIVLGYTGLALNSVKPGDSVRHDLEEIQKAAQAACLLTRQLLASSRRQIVVPTVVDLNKFIREMKGMVHRLIGERIDLIVLLQPELGSVRADPGQISQVILNLVVNARDAMPEGGKLNIQTSSWSSQFPLTLKHTTLAAGKYLVLSVADSGAGIAAQDQDRVFEPFFTTKPNGTGLGLSTVLGIVQQSNGGIQLESQPGTGTTIRIFLPITEEPAPASGSRLTPTDALADETILIVEDDDAVRRVIFDILQTAGYRILTAKTGEEALRIYSSGPLGIHLALIDMVLPDIDGRDLGDRLSAFKRGTIIAYMSGYIEKDLLRIEDLGNLNFIQKPFTSIKLLESVRQMLDAD